MNWYQRHFGWIPRPVRRVIVLVIGGTLLLLGLLGAVMPIMPGIIFVPLALAVLAAEFAWATRWLYKIKHSARSAHTRIKNGWLRLNGRRRAAPATSVACVDRTPKT
jgi:hypothetical protein